MAETWRSMLLGLIRRSQTRTKNSRQFPRLTPRRTRSPCSLTRLVSGDELFEQVVCRVTRVLRRCNRHMHGVGLLLNLESEEGATVSEPAVPEGRPATRCRRLAAISDSFRVVPLRPSFMLHRIECLRLSRNRSLCELAIKVVQTPGRSS
jgi:hypothetical protein